MRVKMHELAEDVIRGENMVLCEDLYSPATQERIFYKGNPVKPFMVCVLVSLGYDYVDVEYK